MPSKKLEKLKNLSPLAAAIAFSATLPTQIHADSFTIESQADLDIAIDYIDEVGDGEGHTITFTSDVDGEGLSLSGFNISNYTYVTIDGEGASNLELILGNDTIDVYSDSSLEIKNLDLTIERDSYFSSDAPLNASGYSELTLENVSIEVYSENSFEFAVIDVADGVELDLDTVQLDANYEAEGLIAEKSDVTIANSSFTNMANGIGIDIYNGGGYVKYIDISDTTFNYNDSDGLISISTYYSNYDNGLEVTLNNIVIENNYSGGDLVSVTDAEGHLDISLNNMVFDSNTTENGSILDVVNLVYNSSSEEQELNLILANSTFSNNEAEGGSVVNIAFEYEGGYSRSSLNAGLGNVTLANNTSSDGTLNIYADRPYNYRETDISIGMAHVTMANNGPVEGSPNAYSGLAIYNERPDRGDKDFNVNIVNSIISGNLGSESNLVSRSLNAEPSSYTSIDTDLYSNVDISVDNSLIGVVSEAEGEIKGYDNIIGEDPMLGELADNGGTMMTMLPKAGSPVIDAGYDDFADAANIDLTLLFDQRGEERVRGDAPDMGAVEAVPAGEEPTKKKKKSDGLFGSLGLGSLIATFGLLGLRRKRK